MKYTILVIIAVSLFACSPEQHKENQPIVTTVHDTLYITETTVETVYVEKKNEYEGSDFYISERLPPFFRESGVLENENFTTKYQIDSRLNPFYLEADFNGDGYKDIALSIKEIATNKAGVVIIHGNTDEHFIVGAGTNMKEGSHDDLVYVDIWKINYKHKNEPGLTEDKPLLIDVPSLQIEASEVGGGLIYWDGKAYSYFHQTC